MTPRQNKFIAEYTLGRNATSAAIKAGYSPRTARQTGSENLTKPDIRAAVAEYEAANAERLAVTRDRVITEIKAAIALAQEQRNPAAQIAGWREIAKICGYYAPERKQIELRGGHDVVRAEYEAMSDAELIAVVEAG